jgi:hypothetical protein
MRKISDTYILVGFIWLVIGMVFGMWLGITNHLNFANSHAHLNLVGFATSVLFGLIYRAYPALGRSGMAWIQFALFEIGAILLVIGKVVVDGGGSDTIVAIGSIVVLIGTLAMVYLFAARRQEA